MFHNDPVMTAAERQRVVDLVGEQAFRLNGLWVANYLRVLEVFPERPLGQFTHEETLQRMERPVKGRS